jgi:Putative restriction endonuclease
MTVATSLPPTSPFEPPKHLLKRFTVEEYHRMIRAGALDEEDRFELLEGWVVYKVTKNPLHDATVDRVQEVLRDRLPGYRIRVQSAITTADSEPEPDVVAAIGPASRYNDHHPGPPEIVLVVEVADSSLPRDRAKRTIYARARISVYWIVNLPEHVVEVYTDPTGPDLNPVYRGTQQFVLNDAVPLSVGGQPLPPIPVNDIFT